MNKLQGRKNARFKAHLMACGAGLAMASALMVNGVAMAQDAAPADDTVVVVTGIRKGIQDAISVKRKNSQIVEAVSAEDIGKLPDASIAESIARLPGIAAQRTNGRAQSLSVRGLGPDYTVTTLNGREQVSTNDNRSVEFDQYPSELISSVLVYKTPKADMVVQGIAGTADLQTVRPLNFSKRVMAVNYRYEMNSEDAAIGGNKNTGNRYSFTYINQFADRTIGLALGYAHTSSPYQATKKESWGYPNFDANNLIVGGEKDQVQSSNLERDGFMGVLQWRPNDQLNMTIDAYHSESNELQRIARLEYPLYWSAAALQPGYTTANGYVNHGVFTGVNTVVENYVNEREATVDSIGWNTEYHLNDSWDLMADISYSKIERSDLILESTAGTGFNGSGAKDTITFDQTALGLTQLHGVLDYSDFSKVYLTDPGGWGGPAGRAGYVKSPDVEDTLTTMKFAATRHLEDGIFNSVTFGFNRTERTKKKVGVEGFIVNPGAAAEVVVPDKYRTGTTDASFLGGVSGMIAYDSLNMWKDGFWGFSENTCGGCVTKTWTVEETVDTAYVMAGIETQWGDIPVTGNIGVQAVTAKQTGTSFITDGNGGLALSTGGTEYTDVLPSLSLNLQVAEDMTLRLGAASTISRPRMDEMASGISGGPITDTAVPNTLNGQKYYWSGGGGNPDLRPWKANAFDISLEKYFGRKGYVSVAAFYKDLTSYVVNGNALYDFSASPLPAPYTSTNPGPYALANANRMGILSGKVNGNGGVIKGIELTASVPGEVVAPWLDGFGMIASAAFNDSDIDPFNTGTAIDLPGLSKTVVNATFYYEKNGFSARVSNRYRDDFLGEVPDYTNTLENRWVHAESVVDAQISYQFQSGPMNGLTVYASGSNLTNEPFYIYGAKGQPNRILRYEKYGSTYLFGVSYKF